MMQLIAEVNPMDFVSLNIHDVLDKVKRSASQGYGSHVLFEESYDHQSQCYGDFDLLMQAFHNIVKFL